MSIFAALSTVPAFAQTPDAPTGLVATRGDGQVVLTWDPADFHAPFAHPTYEMFTEFYRVYRATTPGDDDFDGPPTTYTDAPVTPGTTYYYTVTAVLETTNLGRPPGGGDASNSTLQESDMSGEAGGTSYSTSAQWLVEDQNGNALSANNDGSYSLRTALHGTGQWSGYPAGMDYTYLYVSSPFNSVWDPECFGGSAADLTPGLNINGWLQNNCLGSATYNNQSLNGSVNSVTDSPPIAQFVYIGPGQAPDHLNVLVHTSLSASAALYYNLDNAPASGLSSAAASDGIGASVTAEGAYTEPGGSVAPQTGGSARPMRLPVQGGVAQLSVPASVSVSASNLAPYGDDGATETKFNASAAATVQQDDRVVAIGPVTNMKGPEYNSDGSVVIDVNGDIQFVPTPHAVVDNAMYGDIGLQIVFDNPDQDNYQSLSFQGERYGNWTVPQSAYNWFSSLKQSGDSNTLINANDIIPDFTNRYALPVVMADSDAIDPPRNVAPTINHGDTGKVDHIHLTYTEGLDRATASADYYLNLHKSEEFLHSQRQSGTVFKELTDLKADDPGFATLHESVICHWNAPSAIWDYLGGGVDAMAEISGLDDIPWLGLFCATAGIAIDHLKPVADSGTADFDGAWNDPDSDFPDEAAHPHATTDARLFKMLPHMHGLFARSYTLKDEWGNSGFVGETTIISDTYVRGAGAYGTFVYDDGMPNH